MGQASGLEVRRGRAFHETHRCPGGTLCLDFCNTGQGARDRRGGEWLADCRELLEWLASSGAIEAQQARRLQRLAQADPEAAARVHRQALELREVLQRAIAAHALGHAPAPEDLARISAEHLRSAAHARLAWKDGRAAWTLDPDADALAASMQPVLQSAIELLTSDALARVRRCGNPTCSWLFVDETRNRSRRWCEMASCGNVHKVRRHRERAKGARALRRR